MDRAKSLRISLPDNSPSFPLTNILVCLAWGQSRGKSALGSLCSPMTPTCVLFSLPAHSPPFPCPQSPNILSVCLSVCLSVSFSSPQPCKPCVCVCVRAKLLQSCPTPCDPMDCSPLGSSVHGDSPGKKLECVAMPSSRGSSQPKDQTHIS